MKNATLLIALAALVGAGCSRKDAPAPEPAPTPAPVAQDNPNPPSTAPEPSVKVPKPGVDTPKPSAAAKLVVPPIPPKGKEGWSAIKLSPTDVAAKMDTAMTGLKNVSCVATIVGATPRGKIMPNTTFPAYIKNATTFRLSYMRLTEGVPFTGMATADGTSVVHLKAGGMSAPRKLGSPGAWDSKPLVSEWPGSFAEHVFDGLTVRNGLWAALVKGWSSGTRGYKLTLEERVTPYKGRNIKNYRYVAERAVGKAGKTEQVEVIVDAQIFLPVTIRTVSYDARGSVTKLQWSGDWRNNQVLDPKMFLIKS